MIHILLKVVIKGGKTVFVTLGLIMCLILFLLSKDKLYILIGFGMLLSIFYIYFYNWTYSSNLRRAAMFMFILYFLLYGNRQINKKGGDEI